MKKLGLVGGMGPESTIPNECAVLNMGYDTDYVDSLLEEMDISQVERKAFIYYSLLYCMDFMGERGTQFGDKKIDVNEMIISHLNQIFDNLINEWNCLNV